ncbi:MAG: TIGR02281 family clan AA aspartic protease [Porticoccaceae bacterium]|nr:TIGR02281 family clan AA aspartic protease [Porticoccaceae bacterium]
MSTRGFWLALCLLFVSGVCTATTIEVKGLFNGRAILVIDGQNRLLKAGETSPEGVLLVASNSKSAEVEINGERQTLSLSRRISTSFSAAEKAELRVPRAADSHYWVRGTINGHPVQMMVDTGATLVAMNSRDADRLGIDYQQGKRGRSATASGLVNNYIVQLDKVTLGTITVRQVPAAIIEGDFPVQILLGNSLLGRLEMQMESDVMVLRQKF